MKAGRILLTLAVLAMAAGVGQAQNNRNQNVNRATQQKDRKTELAAKKRARAWKARTKDTTETPTSAGATAKTGETYHVEASSTQFTQKTVEEIQQEKKAAEKDSLRKKAGKIKRHKKRERKTR